MKWAEPILIRIAILELSGLCGAVTRPSWNVSLAEANLSCRGNARFARGDGTAMCVKAKESRKPIVEPLLLTGQPSSVPSVTWRRSWLRCWDEAVPDLVAEVCREPLDGSPFPS